jgi:hypothetical protein
MLAGEHFTFEYYLENEALRNEASLFMGGDDTCLRAS